MPVSNGTDTDSDWGVAHPPSGAAAATTGAMVATVAAAAGATAMAIAASGQNEAIDGGGILAFALTGGGQRPGFYVAYAVTMVALAIAFVLLLRVRLLLTGGRRTRQRVAKNGRTVAQAVSGVPKGTMAQHSACNELALDVRYEIDAHTHSPCPNPWPLGVVVEFFERDTNNLLATSPEITVADATVTLKNSGESRLTEGSEETEFWVEVS